MHVAALLLQIDQSPRKRGLWSLVSRHRPQLEAASLACAYGWLCLSLGLWLSLGGWNRDAALTQQGIYLWLAATEGDEAFHWVDSATDC